MNIRYHVSHCDLKVMEMPSSVSVRVCVRVGALNESDSSAASCWELLTGQQLLQKRTWGS